MMSYELNNKVRILCIISSMNRGGAETFLMKMIRSPITDDLIFDFCLTSTGGVYEEEIRNHGGKVFKYTEKSKHPIKSFAELVNIVRDNKYDYVIRINEHSLAALDLLAAYFGGARNLIMRSSNASSGSLKRRITHYVFRFLPKYLPSVKIAPSVKAGMYTFGKDFSLLNNGLELNDYLFDEKYREEYRGELGLKDSFVVGHVGRFMKQKNHSFLLEIFKSICEVKKNAVLVLVGVGELEYEIKDQIKKLELDDKVMFLGTRDDVNKLYMAMDVFVFPSLYEGMPNTVIEAQATGLKCIISDTITDEVKITQCIEMRSLNDNYEEWANSAIQPYSRSDWAAKSYKELKIKGYDMCDVAEKFKKLIIMRTDEEE